MRDDLRPGSTRDRLVEAGIALLDELPTDRLLAGVPTAAVAEAVGVTTGSFFHHFPTAADFVAALVRSYRDEVAGADLTDELVAALDQMDVIGVQRAHTDLVWQTFAHSPDVGRRFRVQLHLWAHHTAALPPTREGAAPGEPDVATVLRRMYREREQTAVRNWTLVLEQVGLLPAPPYTLPRVATALTAMLDGLLIRQAVDPDSVDDQLYTDVSALVTMAILRPAEERRRTEELVDTVLGSAARSPQAISGARRRRASRERIARLATGMFDQGWEEVSASEVAERTDVVPQTVINLFGHVRGVAALTFVRHLPALRAAADSHRAAGPRTELRAVLRQLALLAAGDPEAARALLEERLATALRFGGDLGDLDVRLEVPLAEVVLRPLDELDLGDRDRLDLATTLLDVVLVHAIPRPGRPDDTAEVAMALLPATATDPPPDPAGGAAGDGM